MDFLRHTTLLMAAQRVSTALVVLAVGRKPSTAAQHHFGNQRSEYQFDTRYSWTSAERLSMKPRASSLMASMIVLAFLRDPSGLGMRGWANAWRFIIFRTRFLVPESKR